MGGNTALSFDPWELTFTVLPYDFFPHVMTCFAERLSLGAEYSGQTQLCLNGNNPTRVT